MRTSVLPRVSLRTAARLVAALLLALVGLGLLAGPASAHTELLGSDPAAGAVVPQAPDQVTLTFNEPIRVVARAVHLFTAEGAELRSPATSVDSRVLVDLPGALAPGSYTLAWRVISADGHPVSGALVFSVGAPSSSVAPVVRASGSGAVQVAISAVQALVYLGIFLAVGLIVFRQLLLPVEPAAEPVRSRLLTLARRGADVGFIASLLLLPLTTINQRGDRLVDLFAARSWEIDLGNPEPTAAIMAMFGLALAVTTSGNRRLQSVVPLAGGVLALSSLAVVGHSRSFGPQVLVIASDVTHVLAGSVWLGGLVGVAVTLRMLGESPGLAARTVGRFSAVAALLLVAVGASGTVLTWRILGSFHGFVDTSFGRTLLVKLSLVAVVVVLAGVNRWRLLPALSRDGASGGRSTGARLRRAVRIEGLLLIGVLAVTGVLVDRTPETGAAGPSRSVATARVDTATGTVRVRVALDPARVGSNTITIVLTDRTGSA
ncbi:MAG: copper resistance CopC/CopD family protein, partial [Marmoricola sp.]